MRDVGQQMNSTCRTREDDVFIFVDSLFRQRIACPVENVFIDQGGPAITCQLFAVDDHDADTHAAPEVPAMVHAAPELGDVVAPS